MRLGSMFVLTAKPSGSLSADLFFVSEQVKPTSSRASNFASTGEVIELGRLAEERGVQNNVVERSA